MNIKALITTLAIVGSSSVAMARPATVSANAHVTASAQWSFGTSGPTIRDHRTTNPWVRPAPMPVQPQYFGHAYNAGYDRMQRFDLLDDQLNFGAGEYRKDLVPGIAERYSMLKIDADQGRTYIMKVVVEFADGTSQQQINLDKTLRAGESLTIDLAGRSHTINRILVYRADSYDTSHLNEMHRGEFSVSAL